MHIPKKLAVGVTAAAVTGTALFGGATAFAKDDATTGDSLVSKVASTFNLNQSEVKKVFDQHHDELEAQRETKWQEKLDEAVASGELTEAKATLIKEKRAELKTQTDELKPENPGEQTDEERRAHHEQIQTQRDELKQWAEDNGIELRWLAGFGPGMGHGGPDGDIKPIEETTGIAAPAPVKN